jgi:hypothetical protein
MPKEREISTWSEFIAEHPEFPDMMWRWTKLMQTLLRASPIREGDDLGYLIIGFMMASMIDVNDILILSHADSRTGAGKILRSIYERTVTMKYLAADPSEVSKFIGYAPIDWKQVIDECEARSKYRLTERARSNLAKAAKEARQEYRGETCPTCGQRKQADWTPKSVRERAELTGLAHMHFHGSIVASKMLHSTFYGTLNMMKAPALYNIPNCTHELLVHNLLIHRRHFVKGPQPTPMMTAAVKDFLRIWVFAETSFDGVLKNYREL